MSRYYADLHDRELLAQAQTILNEVQRRNLVEVFLPVEDCSPEEIAMNSPFPRRLSFVGAATGKLRLIVEDDFFRRAQSSSSA